MSKYKIIVLTLILLSACSINDARVKATEQKIAHAQSQADNLYKNRLNDNELVDNKYVNENDEVYLSAVGSLLPTGMPLPQSLEGRSGITINAREQSLSDLAREISDLTGIPVSINLSSKQDAAAVTNKNPLAEATNDEATTSMAYTGPTSGLLNNIASTFNVHWEYNGEFIRFYRYITRTFAIYALPNQNTISADVVSDMGISSSSSSTSGSNNDSSSNFTAKSSASYDIWQDLENNLKTLVGSEGDISFSRAAGTVTVSALPDTMKKIEKFIKNQNEGLSRQVGIEVKIYALTTTDEEDKSFNLSALFQSAKDGFSLGLGGANLDVPTDSGGISVGIIDAPTGSSNADWNGSQIIGNALSNFGSVSTVTSTAITTLNAVTAPIQVTREKGYLKEVSTETTTNVGSTTTLVPGTVVTGLSMMVTPRIMKQGIMLHLATSLSELLGFDVNTSGDSSIQSPEITKRSWQQQFVVKSGSTLVLAGYEQTSLASESTSFLRDKPFFGNGNKREDNRTILVVVITPREIKSPLAGAAGNSRL